MAILSRAVFLGIKHAARAMKPQGRGAIVSLASTAGIVGGQGPHVYTMAKHGVVGLTKSAACELARLGIRVNAVAPGGTVTPMTNALGDNNPESTAQFIAASSPLGFACMPEDIARGILFLLSDDTRYMTGHTLVIDAGVTTGAEPPPFFSQDADILLHAGLRGMARREVEQRYMTRLRMRLSSRAVLSVIGWLQWLCLAVHCCCRCRPSRRNHCSPCCSACPTAGELQIAGAQCL